MTSSAGSEPEKPDPNNDFAAAEGGPQETTSRFVKSTEGETKGHESAIPAHSDHQSTRGTSTDIPLDFGRYRIEKELGRGGMGVVYLAHDRQLDRRVALKIPFFADENDTIAVERFYREARAMATVRHANLCPVYDVGQFEQWHFLTMAFIEGQPLSRKLKKDLAIAVPQAAKLMRTVALAVQKAHEAGIVHRDLKPANIMLTSDLEPIIMDFGLARREGAAEVELTQSLAVMGSPGYMAPEQVEARHDDIGPATDVYAMGIILYLMVTGQRPFRGSVASVFGQIVERMPDPPSRLCADLPNEIDAICLRAIAKAPSDRYASAAEFAEELTRCMPGQIDLSQTAGDLPSQRPQVEQETRVDELSGTQHAREAELRQITIAVFAFEPDELSMSSSLSRVSTSQSEQLLDQAQSFAAFVDQQVRGLGGVTLQSTGEEVIACFGFPQAFEDATQRAVRAALQVMRQLDPDDDGQSSDTATLPSASMTCVTIHSGEAVAEMAEGTTGTEYSIVGEARNVAARLSAVTDPGAIFISPSTYQRVQLFFELESLGMQRVRGMGQTVELYRVIKEASSRNRVELVDPGNLTPLVGRDTELTILKDRWEQALDDLGQIVLLIGDAGLGKSRLIRELREHVISEDGDAAIIELRSSQYHQNTAYFPLVEYLSQLLHFEHQPPENRLESIVDYLASMKMDSADNVALFCNLLGVPTDGRFPALAVSPQKLKELSEELLLEWLKNLVEVSPLLFIVEDLHWVDPSTIAFIERHVELFESGRALTLLTFRPEFETPWKSKPHQTQIALNRLTKRQIGQMVKKRTRQSDIPETILKQLIDRTEGIPLFIEEFSNVIAESGILNDSETEYSSISLQNVIPATLHDLLVSRLDRMEAERDVIQLAATIGREFNFELLDASCELPKAELQIELEKLVHAEILFQKGKGVDADYIFKHALLQDAAYGAMLSRRRQSFHRQIAEALESQFPEVAEAQPALLAQHFTGAGVTDSAVQYWLQAGRQAQQSSANTEAINHLTRGLEVLAELDESTQRDQLELGFQLTLAPVLMAARGWSAPEVGTAIERAQQLVSKIGSIEDQFFVMWGLWGWRIIRADIDICSGIADEILQLVENSPEGQELLAEAHWVIGATAYYKGDFRTGLKLLEKGVELVDGEKEIVHSLKTGQRCGLMCRSHVALALWELGFPDQALRQADDSVRLAKEQGHAFTLAMVLFFRRQVLEFCGFRDQALASIEEEYNICHENGFVFFEVHAIFGHGDALLRQGKINEAREQFDRGLKMLTATGGNLSMDHPYRNIAESFLAAGLPEDARQWLDRGFDLVNNHHERGMESEFLRLQGEVALAAGDQKLAGECYVQAIEVARDQHAKSWELRATISLSELQQQQGKRIEAQQLLTECYRFFAEGFETADLVRAKSLLNHLQIE